MEQQKYNRSNSGDAIKLNVGGKLFQTTASTLQSAGPDSLLAVLSTSTRNSSNSESIFIDRDPEIFHVLLSLLRSGHLPSTTRRFSEQEIAEEAFYYGMESCLRSAVAPAHLSGFDASLVATIEPTVDGFVSSFSAGCEDGSVWVAHGGQISAYDWMFSHVGSVRTHLDDITTIRKASADVAAVGSTEAPGLHFYNVVSGGHHLGSVHWRDQSDPRVFKARVASIAVLDPNSSCSRFGDSAFAAFECPHRENGILMIDKTTLKVVSEIGRQNGSSTKTAVAGKLSILPAKGLLFASAVSRGAFGYSGYMRLWDPRIRHEVVWETTEPGSGRSGTRFGDAFADADVDREEESAIYKVCWKSGDVAMVDLRKLGGETTPWVYLEERSGTLRKADGGEGSVLHCYRNQVFVGKQAGLEVWSHVYDDDDDDEEEGRRGGEFRRNFVDGEEQAKVGIVRSMEGGGNRLFVIREGVEGLQVWETCHRLSSLKGSEEENVSDVVRCSNLTGFSSSFSANNTNGY